MPVTVKRSSEFYEKLGDNVANELVNWFNQVDATYKNELRELNELNFARLTARLDQGLAEVRAEIGTTQTRFDAKLDQRMAELDAKWEHRIGELKNSLILWMFGFWTATTFIMLGTTIAILKL